MMALLSTVGLGAEWGLRRMRAEDRAFLRSLYGEGRRHERGFVGWPDDRWEAFLDSQFLLQQAHYVGHHPEADRWLIERRGAPSGDTIGRLDLDCSGSVWRLLEFAIRVDHQGQGIGTVCLRWLQTAAAQAGAVAIDLHVLHGNDRARRLYARHGFVEAEGGGGMHQRMQWCVG